MLRFAVLCEKGKACSISNNDSTTASSPLDSKHQNIQPASTVHHVSIVVLLAIQLCGLRAYTLVLVDFMGLTGLGREGFETIQTKSQMLFAQYSVSPTNHPRYGNMTTISMQYTRRLFLRPCVPSAVVLICWPFRDMAGR